MSGRLAKQTTPDAATVDHVKAAIASAAPGAKVNVEARNGNVYLTGSPKDVATEVQVVNAAQNAAPGHRIVSYLSAPH